MRSLIASIIIVAMSMVGWLYSPAILAGRGATTQHAIGGIAGTSLLDVAQLDEREQSTAAPGAQALPGGHGTQADTRAPSPEAQGPSFRAIDLFIDPAGRPLAAYQLEFRAIRGDVKIVGIEGGEHPAFADPPYYDPKAMQGERVIVAAFSTRPPDQLPAGPTRLMTIHVQVAGDVTPEYTITPQVLAGPEGEPLEVTITPEPREAN